LRLTLCRCGRCGGLRNRRAVGTGRGVGHGAKTRAKS
jgi:hypothetical protein